MPDLLSMRTSRKAQGASMQESPRTGGQQPVSGMAMLCVSGDLQVLYSPVNNPCRCAQSALLCPVGAWKDVRPEKGPGPPGEWIKGIWRPQTPGRISWEAMRSLCRPKLSCSAQRDLASLSQKARAGRFAVFLAVCMQRPGRIPAHPCASRTHPGQGGERWRCKGAGAPGLESPGFTRSRRRG